MKMKFERLTRKNISPYGRIIDKTCVKDNGRGNRFGILLKERSKGWRIGYLILRDKNIVRLESHPDSFETFEPVKGKIAMALAMRKDPENMKVFLLDRPVVLAKGIWHEVLAISGTCEIKIFENIEVKTKYYHLKEAAMV